MVWKRILEANLKLKPTKCCLMRAQVPFLGHIVSREGVGMDPAKTEAVEKWPTPVNVKDVRAFLGLASYYPDPRIFKPLWAHKLMRQINPK